MKTATIREAQHHLSKLLREVEAGEEIVLTRRGKEVAKLLPMETAAKEVDWPSLLAEHKDYMAKMPKVDGSPVLEERESYRF